MALRGLADHLRSPYRESLQGKIEAMARSRLVSVREECHYFCAMTKSKEQSNRAARRPPMILGWREWVSLPDLGVWAIKAKLDTGARSSSLHVASVKVFHRGGVEWVRFLAVHDRKGQRNPLEVSSRVHDERMVRDSGGHEHLRIVIHTNLEIAGWAWPVDVTLASRTEMSFRMLIGRQGLTGHAIVDPSRSYLAGRPRPRRASRGQTR